MQLRKLVQKDLYAEYLRRDEYLIPFLRTRKLDVNKAADLLRTNLKWRKEERIDNLPSESFPQFESTYKTDLLTHTRDGRPVALFTFGSWDVRKAALSGQIKLLVRYLVKTVFEMPQLKAREEGLADGSNATQFVVIADLGGFNLRQQLCVRCPEFALGYIQNYEAHYPQSAASTMAINSPQIFNPIIQLTRPFMSEHFFTNFHLLGPHITDWKPKLDDFIEEKELPKRYGGTHPRNL